MLDLRQVLDQFDAVERRLRRRGAVVALDEIRDLAARRRTLIQTFEGARQRQKAANEQMRTADKKSNAFQQLRDELRTVAQTAKDSEAELKTVEAALEDKLLYLPNPPHESVPNGQSAEDNVVVRQWGTPPSFDFAPKPHWELGEALRILDFERGAKLSGARFTAYRGLGAKLERALISFMLDVAAEHGYTEWLPPFVVKREVMVGTGQLPKFEEDAFALENGQMFLIPTAEVPLTNLHREEILASCALPLRYTAFTPCFRREAGSYGKDVRGLIRQHQFNKVELVKICEPSRSYEELEGMVADAANVLERLGLAHRVVLLCAGDMGFSSAKTYDIEVWLPGQGGYREISSCSNCEDFQARRANIRFREGDDGKPKLVHTLNGSGLAVGRTLIAILENYQRADGSVDIPPALRRYVGVDRIGPPSV
jgi:seryl-tRNA synthetase